MLHPELNIKKIQISDHAALRAKERFDMPDRNHALGHFRNLLGLATRVGKVSSEDGSDAILYAHGKTAIYVSTDFKTIKTVNKHDQIYSPIKNKIIMIHKKEFGKLERAEKSKLKKLEDMKLKLAIEKAELEYRFKKTRSDNVRSYCIQRKKEINEEISIHQRELDVIRSSKRSLARSMVSVL